MTGQAQLINGKKIALSVLRDLKNKVAKLPGKPGLAIILIGDDPGSRVYVSLKEEAAKEIGMHFKKHIFPATVDETEIIELIKKLNIDQAIHGIVVQFPLPRGFSKEKIITAVALEKDVDGFHPKNIKALLAGQARINPGLSTGIMKLLASTRESLAGKKAVIVARSRVFKEPLDYYLSQQGVEVMTCDPDKTNCDILTKKVDILMVAVGQPGFITAAMVKPGAVVIDVGYNRVNGKPVGDVDFNTVKDVAGWITPVPGGVGPMTVAMLLSNVLKVYEIQNKR